MSEDEEPDMQTALVPAGPLLGHSAMSRRERDYVMFAIFTRMQHQRPKDALRLVEAMIALGETGPDVYFARAVVQFHLEDFEAVIETLRHLDRIDPPKLYVTKKADEKLRMRSFMRARSHFSLTGTLDDEGRASLDMYLRQSAGPKAAGKKKKR